MKVALPRDMVMEIEEDRAKIAFGGRAISAILEKR